MGGITLTSSLGGLAREYWSITGALLWHSPDCKVVRNLIEKFEEIVTDPTTTDAEILHHKLSEVVTQIDDPRAAALFGALVYGAMINAALYESELQLNLIRDEMRKEQSHSSDVA